eukprot:724706-Heterocapsa_arctica.AAC.1
MPARAPYTAMAAPMPRPLPVPVPCGYGDRRLGAGGAVQCISTPVVPTVLGGPTAGPPAGYPASPANPINWGPMATAPLVYPGNWPAPPPKAPPQQGNLWQNWSPQGDSSGYYYRQ